MKAAESADIPSHRPADWAPPVLLALILLSVIVRYGDLHQPPLAHGDEALTAVRSLSLLHEGHFWTPHWNGDVNLHKPPFYYWLVAAGYLVFGVNEFAVRLPSVICFLLLLIVVYRMNSRLFGPWAGVIGAAILSLHPVLVEQSRLGMMDTLVALVLMAGGYCLWLGRTRPAFYLAWGALCGISVLSKGGGGLVCLPISLFYLAIANRFAFRSRFFYGGLGLLILIPGIWFGSQYMLHPTELLDTYFGREISYRVGGEHKFSSTFCVQATTGRLWISFGSLAPLAFSSILLILIADRNWLRSHMRDALFLPLSAVLYTAATNLIRQQMYWYIVPAAVPLGMLTAGTVWLAVSGRLRRGGGAITAMLLLAGTGLPWIVAFTGRAFLWAVGVAAVVAILADFLPAAMRRTIGGPALLLALSCSMWFGVSADNPEVNMTRLRDSSELKDIAGKLAALRRDQTPVVVGFRYFPMNAFLFYTRGTVLKLEDFVGRDGKPANRYYGVFRGDSYKELASFEAEVLAREPHFTLVRLTRK